MKKLILLLLFIPLFSFGQINFQKVPKDFQLFPRDENNNSYVVFSGNISENSEDLKLKLKVFKDDILINEKSLEIIDKKFKSTSTIKAGLYQYKFELYKKVGKNESLLYKAINIVCGDAYIITGQSNSHASSEKSIYSSRFARSFGVKTGYETYSDKDKMVGWGLATGNCKNCEGNWDNGYGGGWFVNNPHSVGVWGMELAKLLIDKYKIPICIVNGGSGSSTIEENMLYPEKVSLETSFGRLAYRVDQAELKDHVKAIFYHQGESDATLERSLSYSKNFDSLYNDWHRVYKGLSKIYIYQIHPGCGGDFQSEIREIQNQISNKFNNVEIMSTTGILGHDGCHFSYEGYKEFANRILPLVSRDFYGENSSSIITPPQLLSSYYSGKKEITLTFDQKIKMEFEYELNGLKHLMKNQFFFSFDNKKPFINGVINKLELKDYQIIIHLNTNQKFSNITWLPNKDYSNTKDVYNGPWISGLNNNIGALSFDNRIINK